MDAQINIMVSTVSTRLRDPPRRPASCQGAAIGPHGTVRSTRYTCTDALRLPLLLLLSASRRSSSWNTYSATRYRRSFSLPCSGEGSSWGSGLELGLRRALPNSYRSPAPPRARVRVRASVRVRAGLGGCGLRFHEGRVLGAAERASGDSYP